MKLYGIKRVRLLGLLSSKVKIWAILCSDLKSFLFIKGDTVDIVLSNQSTLRDYNSIL
jgi:hypothetical protein